MAGWRDDLLHQVGVEGDALGAVVSLVDPHQSVGQLEHVGPQGDDDELGVLGPLLDVVGHYGHVLEVQGGVDLVHDVEWGGLVVVEGEDESQGGQGLLATRQVADVLPRLLGRSYLQRWPSEYKSLRLKNCKLRWPDQ